MTGLGQLHGDPSRPAAPSKVASPAAPEQCAACPTMSAARRWKDGLITSEWGTTDNNRRARYYELTAAGRRALGEEIESWRRFAAGLEAVLSTT